MNERERRLRASFDASSAFLAVLSVDGSLLEINACALALMGTSRERVLGRSFPELDCWPAEVRDRARAAVVACAAGEVVRVPLAAIVGSSSQHVNDCSLRPAYGGTGSVEFLLLEGVADAALARARALERSFSAIAESSSVFVHEIKNPITAVNLALRAVADELGEDHRVILEDLVARMRKVESMARDALSLLKPPDP